MQKRSRDLLPCSPALGSELNHWLNVFSLLSETDWTTSEAFNSSDWSRFILVVRLSWCVLQHLLLEQKQTQRWWVDGMSTSTMNHISKQAAVIVLNNTHLHFSPNREGAGCREAHAIPFHMGTITPLLRGEELPDNGSRAVNPNGFWKLAFHKWCMLAWVL